MVGGGGSKDGEGAVRPADRGRADVVALGTGCGWCCAEMMTNMAWAIRIEQTIMTTRHSRFGNRGGTPPDNAALLAAGSRAIKEPHRPITSSWLEGAPDIRATRTASLDAALSLGSSASAAASDQGSRSSRANAERRLKGISFRSSQSWESKKGFSRESKV